MSVIIKGMKMPKDCFECDFQNPFVEEPYCRRLMKRCPEMRRLEDCPLAEVPTPHGRLIDANKLFTWFDGDSLAKYPIGDAKQYNTIMYYEVFGEIDDAPTVIEAEE